MLVVYCIMGRHTVSCWWCTVVWGGILYYAGSVLWHGEAYCIMLVVYCGMGRHTVASVVVYNKGKHTVVLIVVYNILLVELSMIGEVLHRVVQIYTIVQREDR